MKYLILTLVLVTLSSCVDDVVPSTTRCAHPAIAGGNVFTLPEKHSFYNNGALAFTPEGSDVRIVLYGTVCITFPTEQ